MFSSLCSNRKAFKKKKKKKKRLAWATLRSQREVVMEGKPQNTLILCYDIHMQQYLSESG
jgi:hypothetical protein